MVYTSYTPIWILFGTDSGYESTTTIYYMTGKVWAIKD